MAEVDEVVWDDSVLVDSWTEALNEYKKYHSIHARGGGIKDLEHENTPKSVGSQPTRAALAHTLRSAEITCEPNGTAAGDRIAPEIREEGECQEEEEEEGEVMSTGDKHPSYVRAAVPKRALRKNPNATKASSAGGDDLPFGENGIHQGSAQVPAQAVLGSVEDGNLKRLLMAWYYAGYYMGLYEGHQQAQQPPL
ncbi:hypothetical protein CP533_5674 [Ophiocordyceps camponoti-saundersi (nom. inval.)]|nr:hypothetical protein CP533_5674 [Ophiocordyceps camponoti-saundersi (nom. inval.)]